MKLVVLLGVLCLFASNSYSAVLEENTVYDLTPLTQPIVHTPEDINRAEVVIIINKSEKGATAQRMSVYKNGELLHRYKVSTGREKLEVAKSGREYRTTTPQGYFRPTYMERDHFSETWEAHMEYSTFFIGGVAIHATTPDHYSQLGTRASGGCVRLKYDHAKKIYELIRSTTVRDVTVLNRDGTVTEATDNNYDVLIIVESVQD